MPAQGIRVTLIEVAKKRLISDIIKFHGNRFYLTVDEILKYFGLKLGPSDKIWIKRRDTTECRPRDFERTAQLIWTDFNDCIIAIAETRPSGASLLSFNAAGVSQDTKRSTEDNLKAQSELWKEKKEKKEKRLSRVPRAVKNRLEACQAIIRKKRKARAEAERKIIEEEKKTTE